MSFVTGEGVLLAPWGSARMTGGLRTRYHCRVHDSNDLHTHMRTHLLALLPGRPIVADICVTHPLAASAVKAAARDAKGKDSLKRDKYS